MRRLLKYLVLIVLAAMVFPMTASAALLKDNGLLLQLNNSYILYSYQQMPYIDKNGRTLIPLRMIGDLMGAEVSWDGSKNTATIAFEDVKAVVVIGSKEASVNGKSYMMDTTAVLCNKTTMVPVRFISDVIQVPVEWDKKNNIVTLKDKRFLTAPSINQIDHMENLDESYKGKIVPKKLRFVKDKDPEKNRVTIEIVNASDTTILAGHLHKNLYFYRNENSAGSDLTFGFMKPREGSRGYNPTDIVQDGTFTDYSNMTIYTITGDSIVSNGGRVKYIICNYFIIR